MQHTRVSIDDLLRRNPRAVERAMVVLFNRQTADEQSAGFTRHNNNRGFCGWAASSGSYYAKWVNAGRTLTGKHLNKARKIALHHSRQLVEEANAKTGAPRHSEESSQKELEKTLAALENYNER